jgi:exopolysaccharide biosynthesis polyprenyl glycosylphosphotransferase
MTDDQRNDPHLIAMTDQTLGPEVGSFSGVEPFPRFKAARVRDHTRVDSPIREQASASDSDALRVVALRERLGRLMLAFADALAAAGSVAIVMSLLGGYRLEPEFLIVVPLIILVAKVQGLYEHDALVIHKSTLDEFPALLNLATLFALLTWLARHYVVDGSPPTVYLLALWLSLIVTLGAARATARAFASRKSPIERCLLVGSEAVHRRLEGKFPDNGRVILVGAITVDEVARDHDALRRVANEAGVHRVLVALSDHTDGEETMDVVRGAMTTGMRVSLLPNSIGAVGGAVAFDDLGGVPLLGVPHFGLSRSSLAVKRTVDLIGASFALIVFAPAMAVLAAAIKLDTPGPVLFRQTRVGRDGRHFKMLKFRTMVDGADSMKDGLRGLNEAAGLFKIEADPRITRLGRLLRRSSLDELPQLFNVIRGNMSLVGPRPLVVDEDERVTGYDRRRLQLTPGMTGRWQILGSARIPLSEMVKIDYLYVANWSVWLDLKILLQTIGFVAYRRGL